MLPQRCVPPLMGLMLILSARTAGAGEPLPDGAIARLGDGWLRHKKSVVAAAFSPDGKSLVTSDLEALYVWDLAARSCQRFTPLKRPNGIQALRFSRDGKTLFTASRFGAIRALDPEKGFAAQFTLEETGRSASFFRIWEISDDGKTVMTANDMQGSVTLWDVDNRQVRQRFAGNRGFRATALTRDGKQLLRTRDDGSVRVWDLASDKETLTIEGPTFEIKRPYLCQVQNLAVSPDNRMLAVIRKDQSVTISSLKSGQTRWRLGASNAARTALAISPDGRTLAVIDGQHISLRDAATGAERRRVPSPGGGANALVFSPDSKTLAVAGPDQGVRLWDVATGKLSPAPLGHRSTIWSLRFLPDGKRLASAAGELIVWDVATARELQRQSVSPHSDSLAVDPDGKTLHFFAGAAICSWRTGVDAAIQRRPLPPSSLFQLTLSPDGERMAAMTSQEELFVQERHGARKKRTLEAPRIHHSRLTFSPDGRLLAAASRDNTIRIWSAASGKPLRELKMDCQPTSSLDRLTFSGDGRSLTVRASELHLIEIATGQERARLPTFPGVPRPFAVSRDGRFLALPHPEGKIFIYATATGKQVAELPAHQDDIWALAFSADGRLLASGGVRATILVWKVPPSEQLPAVDTMLEASVLWGELGGSDAPRAYRALAQLANASAQTLPLIKTRFWTVWKKLDPARQAQYIADLDSDNFKVREQASRALIEAGPTVEEELLRKALDKNPSAEVKKRIGDILHRLKKHGSDRLRSLRAIEVLERIGTPQAAELLRELAARPLPEELHEDIKASLRRMETRPSEPRP